MVVGHDGQQHHMPRVIVSNGTEVGGESLKRRSMGGPGISELAIVPQVGGSGSRTRCHALLSVLWGNGRRVNRYGRKGGNKGRGLSPISPVVDKVVANLAR